MTSLSGRPFILDSGEGVDERLVIGVDGELHTLEVVSEMVAGEINGEGLMVEYTVVSLGSAEFLPEESNWLWSTTDDLVEDGA